MNDKFDVIVIGGGPGGYVAAIRAAQLGFKTACVEMWRNTQGKECLGGTCLNVGCIPSKALLESSHLFHQGQEEFSLHGIHAEQLTMDVAQMIARKNIIVDQLTSGIAHLFQSNGITWIKGRGRLQAEKKVEVTMHDGTTSVWQAEKGVILAFGSVPIDIPVAAMDGKMIVSSSEALDFTEVPKRLGVIGAGVIGLELGSVWRRLGAEVVIFEALDVFLSAADQQLSKDAARIFKKQGLDIRTGAKVQQARVENNVVVVTYVDKDGEHQMQFDKLLVAVGRKPNTSSELFLGTKVKMDTRGFIEVDEYCQTDEPNVFAIGDCVRGPMLAHKAEEEGIMAAEIIAGQSGHVRYDVIPSIIYTHPEIAWIGKTEEQLKNEGIAYHKGDFPFSANGRAKAMNSTDGFVKILTDAQTDEILGAHIIGPCASEMIHELIVAMEFYAAGEDVARIIHGHPTLSEAVHEAALATNGNAIHKAAVRRK